MILFLNLLTFALSVLPSFVTSQLLVSQLLVFLTHDPCITSKICLAKQIKESAIEVKIRPIQSEDKGDLHTGARAHASHVTSRSERRRSCAAADRKKRRGVVSETVQFALRLRCSLVILQERADHHAGKD